MRRSRKMARCCSSCESSANPLTTFTNEQALYLGFGGALVAGVFGWLLYNAGKSTQQITDMQAYQAGTFGTATTPSSGS